MIMFSFPSIGQVDLLKDINVGMRVPGISGNKAVYGDFVYYNGLDEVTGAELWRSDGTENGTSPVKDINPGKDPSYPSSLIVGNGILYFTADDGVHGRELWRTDGTATGTYMVADIYQGIGSSYPKELAFVNGVLYFNASHPQTGVELWASDGTSAGTRMVADLNTDAGAGSYPEHITEYQNAAYFVADDV
jgi:ELWxxDGT repeat protein